MRIIGLYGHGDCGKSDTLNALKELLRERGRSISTKPHPSCEMPETFEYEGMVVCVAPAGDNRTTVEANCRYFKMKNCGVAVTATRCKGGSVDALNEFAEDEGVEIEWVQKSYEYNLSKETRKLCNRETAEVIFGELYY